MNWPNQVVYLPSNSQMFKAQIPSNPHKSSTSPKFLNLLSPRMYLNLRLFHGTPKCTALLIIFLKHRHVQGIPISSHLWQIAPGRWPLVVNDPVGQGGRGAGVVPVGKNCWVVLLWWSSAQFLATWLRENWKSNFPIFDGLEYNTVTYMKINVHVHPCMKLWLPMAQWLLF